ncbi:MAG: hypothetical protein B0D96_07715 [Candidatus Sedimenticola endophacoides]|uniref:Uncharacterized protein n=1 Tax=Candidatus Sedimenticola endophacoides TaxID=2548426 RepID=A0A657Q606_9GAMM|nr:MAG: hypothetical protein B0D94_12440 [Candidatus Sedimenticola endophacoides]OQX33171.1 MAG: hypothetical protein B0D84_04995 [Candidatus Sedimenticola endophacoides]OQX35056.1 MAG: hypothetical protein B0D96_07715 [Candidatus Sedimenticola endophacoides]OQX40397.1 MAG: hypothetical protein B0D89_07885 [Candidatus Sedimenticola endophacoides]OQX46456.1 MAG: hypothetical protein B0D86_01630 [Candidatus Sedimenticola endophacoides]
MSSSIPPSPSVEPGWLYSVVETPDHPDFSLLYRRLGLRQQCFNSMRRAMAGIKRQPPAFIVAEFLYGFSNNYAGINISNLDVMLFSLQRYAPDARVVVLVTPTQRRYVDQLNAIFPLYAVLPQPVTEPRLARVLGGSGSD